MRRCLAALLLLASPAVHAEWLQASSDHFIIYGDTNERNLRRFAEQLERFDAAMALVTATPRSKPSPSARVTVFLAGTDADVRRIYRQNGGTARNVAGFYSPNLSGPVAYIPDVVAARGRGEELDLPMLVLLHEYAHHFSITNTSFPMPRWLSEGSAEFFASTSFDDDGSMLVGRPANHRGPELMQAPDVTVTDLVDPAHYEKRRGKSTAYDAYYGRAWALYHYLIFTPSRRSQLNAYVDAMMAGKSSREAADAAFGDLKALDREVDAYLRRRSLTAVKIGADRLTTGPVAIRKLTRGEAAAMPIIMQSKRGVSPETAKRVVAEARAVAAKFPGDAAVLAALAEAEHDADDDDAALRAAAAALALDPSNVDAHLQKGYALFRKAHRSEDPAVLREAQRAFLALNRLENDHPIPLMYFYLSQVVAGGKPTANAVAGLAKAVEVAPYAAEIKVLLAHRRLLDGQPDQARKLLMTVANNPHPDERTAKLRDLLARLETGTTADAAALADELGAMTRLGGEEEDATDGDGPGPGAPPGGDKPPAEPASPSEVAVQGTDDELLQRGARRRP